MNKKALAIFLLSTFCLRSSAQASKNSVTNAIANYYKLAMQYKDGNGVIMDDAKSYSYFSKVLLQQINNTTIPNFCI